MSWTFKRRTRFHPAAAGSVVLFVLLAGSSVGGVTEIMPDFALVDVNSTSDTYNQSVSPRDYSQQISAWYFGHASS